MCRCLGGCSHAMSNNEERAWEAWEAEVAQHLAVIRAACDRVEQAVRASRDPGHAIHEALMDEDAAAQTLWKMRDGPGRPE